ncbi:hypothetical protein SKAU_G00198660 [Synaphobranchus kaupii]|uniref:Uncharacterized protein n=1 Tax=Synaphobranchus kaupii TaxID=118154 RepID=A0A9Q1FF31_SYNKA|nr:hypothetical protein SKAU_G00198660 [Synaphobranchus kaupii]
MWALGWRIPVKRLPYWRYTRLAVASMGIALRAQPPAPCGHKLTPAPCERRTGESSLLLPRPYHPHPTLCKSKRGFSRYPQADYGPSARPVPSSLVPPRLPPVL